ncbi:hypothetical protein, partial [Octadecabacter ascidiaceicola]|uniref:hypothetical protein n=1 Tax=Octadecabacter ascidiaceicola TaxID=1655543 RepID=UPI001C5337FA
MSASKIQAVLVAPAAKVRFPSILLKNNVLRAQKVRFSTQRERLSDQALHACCGAGKIFASLR